MEFHEIVPYFLVMLVVLAIVVIFNQSLLSSGFPQHVSENLTKPLVISMLNGQLTNGFGPVNIPQPSFGSGGYDYEITVTPELKLTGTLTGNLNVISIIRFKGRSIMATVMASGVQDDKFTIRPNEDIGTVILRAQIISDIPPITSQAEYNGPLASGAPLLIKDGASVMLAKVNVDKSFDFKNKWFVCHAVFELECANGPIAYSSRLKGYVDSSSPRSDYEEDVELCGGIVHISITKPDCSNNRVDWVDLKYTDGRDWPNVGENVYVSFWKDTTCTRRTADFLQLVALCPDDRLGGEFRLVHDLLPLP